MRVWAATITPGLTIDPAPIELREDMCAVGWTTVVKRTPSSSTCFVKRRRFVVTSAHTAAYAQPLAAAEIRPNVDASPPPSGPWPTYAWTNRQTAYAPSPIATTIRSQWPSGCFWIVSSAPGWFVGVCPDACVATWIASHPMMA